MHDFDQLVILGGRILAIIRDGVAALAWEQKSLGAVESFILIVQVSAVNHLDEDQAKRENIRWLPIVLTGKYNLRNSIPSRHHLASHVPRSLVLLFLVLLQVV